MSLYKYLIFLSPFLGIVSCDSSRSNQEKIDLMSYGLPIEIKGPKTIKVQVDDLGIMKDATVIDTVNNGYNLQIFSSKTDVLDKAKIIAEAKQEIESSEFFSKLIVEDSDGFVYEKKVSDDYINYDFRVFRLRGDMAYTFQAGFGEQYELEDVKNMFNAVK